MTPDPLTPEALQVLILRHLHVEARLHAKHQRCYERGTAEYAAELKRFQGDPKNVRFTRPVYPYPLRVRYQGHGNPKAAKISKRQGAGHFVSEIA